MHSTCILTCSIRGNSKRIQKLFHFKSFHSWCIWPLCWIKLHSASCSHDCILLHARAFLHSRSFKCIIAWLHSPSVHSYNIHNTWLRDLHVLSIILHSHSFRKRYIMLHCILIYTHHFAFHTLHVACKRNVYEWSCMQYNAAEHVRSTSIRDSTSSSSSSHH